MIAVDKGSATSAYMQIYECLKADILAGGYTAEERLPSVRYLAEELGVSRNTVDRAYQQLYAEGFVRGVDRAGFYVEPSVFDVLDLPSSAPLRAPAPPREPLVSRTRMDPRKALPYDFHYGDLPDELFPARIWRKLANEALLEGREINSYVDPLGIGGLREQLGRYLKQARGVHCSSDQVVIQSGIRDGIERIVKLFDPSKDVVAVENPGLHSVRRAFANNGFKVVPLNVASSEAFFADLEHSAAKLVYVTPSHQFPTGKTMSIADRLRLTDWAASHGAYIIEDDYDSEYRYRESPVPSLQSLDAQGRVIYVGTFSKILSPGLRTGYWVLPDALLDRYCERLAGYWCPVPWLTQVILERFFAEGHWERHVRKTVQLFKRKQRTLVGALGKVFGDKVRIEGASAGLHVWAHIDDVRTSRELERLAASKGVGVYPNAAYWFDPSRADPSTILIGYSCIPLEKIEPGIALLGEAWLS